MNRCFGFALGVAAVLAAPGVRAEGRVIPFTTFQAEQQAIVNGLPCKWVSVAGKYSGGRYDLLCKGGTWATISLFVDKAQGMADGVGDVRLQYIEWNPKVHPNAGEAFIAQKFLDFVVDRFVPGSAAPAVLEAFWAERSRSWSGSGVEVKYGFEDSESYGIHRLEIIGEGRTLVGANGVAAAERVGNTATEVTPTDAGLLKRNDKDRMKADEEQGVPWTAIPTPATASKPVQWTHGVAPVAPATLPVPNGGNGELRGREIVVPGGLPASVEDSSTLEKARAALKAMLAQPEPAPLEQATPAELNTAPAPLAKDVPPPEISTTLVPGDRPVEGMPVKAPSNFAAYNKAEELTREIEKRAHTQAILPPKVKAADDAQKTLKAPAVQPAAPVKATPTPAVGEDDHDAAVPGVGKPVRLSPEEMDNGGLGTYDPMNPARSKEVRPLPQLKFIPRAEPVKNPDETIEFEDEGSRL